MFYVYKATNKTNGKVYIGKTFDLQNRWKDHISAAKYNKDHLPFHLAIRKYGSENFEISILEQFDLELDALDKEKYWIDFYKSNIYKYGDEFGYNLTDGGEGVSGLVHSEESKRKMSEAVSGEKNHNFGKSKTDEIKSKMSASNKGKKRSTETRKKISEWQAGRKLPKEVKTKMSESHSGKHLGENNSGAKLSESDVKQIKLLLAEGRGTFEIAKKYGVKERTIRNIRTGRSWNHIV